MPVHEKDDVPTVGTPKRRGRATTPTPAAVTPVRVTRRSAAALADDVPTAETPKKRGRASVNPTPAAVASPVRGIRRSVAALTEEVPAVSSPRRKTRASINPSVTASPARVTRYSLAVPAAEEELETQPTRSPTRSRRKITLPKGKSEANNESETQKEKSASITTIEESPESRPSSAETADQVDMDTKPSQLLVADRFRETNISTRSTRNTPSGSAADRTPEKKIPTRSNRNTPPGSGNSEFGTPTRSQGGSRPSTPVSRNSPRNISDSKTSAKPSPDITSCDLRGNYISSPVRHSPRSSPSKQVRLSFGESRVASPKPSAETKPTSPLGKSASPSQPNTPRSSPRVRNTAKGKEPLVPEKHCLEDEDDSLFMPNKIIKWDAADGEPGPSSNVESLQERTPEKKLSGSPKPEQKEVVSDDSPRLDLEEKNTEHTSTVGDSVGVDGADDEDSEEETRLNVSLSFPGIQKLSDTETSSSDVKIDEEVDHLENNMVSYEASVREQTPPAKDEGSGKPGEGHTSDESVKEVARSEEEEKSLSPVLENDSPPTDTLSASGASLVDEPDEVVENKVGNEIAPSSCEEPQVLELKVNDSGSEKAAENEVKNDEHQEIEKSIIINDSDETGVEESGNPDQDEILVIAESPVSEERSDVSKGNTLTIKDSVVSPAKCESGEGRISDQGETVFNTETLVRSFIPGDILVNEENSPAIKEGIISDQVETPKCESEEGIISDQVETLLNSGSLVSKNSLDASKGEAHNIKESLDVSPVKSEKVRISDLGVAVVSAKYDSLYVPSGETPSIRESLEVFPAKSDAPLDSAFEKSTIEHIPVDEGYSETLDSEYHSSVVGHSDKDVKVPSIVKGLGINDTKQDISVTVKLASQADSGKLTGSSLRTLENIIEDVSENSSVLKSKDGTRESKLSISYTFGDQLVSSSETNNVDTTIIDEHENTDQPSFASSLGLAVSPEPPESVEDDSTSKYEMESSAMKSPSKAVENIDTTTVSCKFGLKKHAVTSETKTLSGGEKVERAPIEQDECGSEMYENDPASVGDSDEERIRDSTSESNKKTEYEEEKIEGALVAPQEECPEIYENDTTYVGDSDEDTGDVNDPVKGSDFIFDEAEEGEETNEESENDENIYDGTEESDSSDSENELSDQNCFILDKAKEAKSSKNKPSSDSSVEDNGAEDGPGTEDVERSGKVVDFDESCCIVENSIEGDHSRELKSEDIPKNAKPESKISSRADKPVFKVTELLDADGTIVNKTQKFASAAASHFVTQSKNSIKMGEPLKSILKSFKALKNGNAYASTAASQFVVSETTSKEKQEKKQPQVVKRCYRMLLDASTGYPQKREQQNTTRIPEAKKRPATEAEALKEKKKCKKETNASGFCVKLCNIAPRTSIDQLKKALEEFDIVTGLQSLEFCPKTEKHKKTAIATYDSKKNLQRVLAGYGKVTVHDRRIFFLLDDETAPISDDQPQGASPKKSPRKKFVGIIDDLPKDITIGDIIGAYEEGGIKLINKVRIYKMRSRKDNLNFVKLEFSKKTALLKAIIVTEKIRIKGKKISLKFKEKSSLS